MWGRGEVREGGREGGGREEEEGRGRERGVRDEKGGNNIMV